MRLLTAMLLASLALPAAAHAIATDRVVGEASPDALAVFGRTLAWTESSRTATTVVLRSPDGTLRRLSAGRTSDGLSLGLDDRGRLVAAYPSCPRANGCTLRLADAATGATRAVPGIRPGNLTQPVVRNGRIAWVSGFNRVFVRALRGGRVLAQAVGRPITIDAIDFDAHRLAIAGGTDDGTGAEGTASELRVVALGSRRVRRLDRTEAGEGGASNIKSPILGPGSAVDASFYDENDEKAATVVRYRPGRRDVVRDVGVFFTAYARGGGATAYVEAPGQTGSGCSVGTGETLGFLDPDGGDGSIPASCRIVLAGADPLGSTARLLPPSLSLDEPKGSLIGGRLTQRALRVGRAVGPPSGVAGVRVRLVRAVVTKSSATFAGQGTEAVTDADGRYRVTPPTDDPQALVAAVTVEAPRTFSARTRQLGG